MAIIYRVISSCQPISDLAALAATSRRTGRVVPLASGAARLMRAYSVQVETLRRLRHGGSMSEWSMCTSAMAGRRSSETSKSCPPITAKHHQRQPNRWLDIHSGGFGGARVSSGGALQVVARGVLADSYADHQMTVRF
jgi:hypothetical protein